MTTLEVVAWSTGVVYALLVHYLAIMHLRDMRDEKTLVGPLKSVGYFILAVGYVLDFIGNVIFSAVVLNPVGLAHKTVSEHTKRLAIDEPDYWRGKFSAWIRRVFLAPADKSGGHD